MQKTLSQKTEMSWAYMAIELMEILTKLNVHIIINS